jgi:surfactin synthase thioesterase subunit
VKGAFLLPPGCTNLVRPCRLLVSSVPSGGSAIRSLFALTNLACAEGWAVLAADGPRLDANVDTVQWGWGILASALEQFSKTWPPAKQWPVACVGFSGGAKRSAAVAAAMTRDGWRVIGVFMGGCNEDRATLGQELFHPPAQFKRVPMYLSNGTDDPIANPKHGAAVRDSMTRSGFVNVRLESYAGRHQFNQDELRAALRWFLQLAAPGRALPDRK